MNSKQKSSFSIQKFLKVFFTILFLLIIAVSIYGLAIYKGWVPIPELATNIVAKQKGLTETEAQNLHKIANLHQIIQQSDNANEFNELQQLVMSGTSEDDLVKFAVDHYENISDETMRSIAEQLGFSEEDFITSKELLEEVLNGYKQSGEFKIGNKEKDELQAIQNKYGLTEDLFQKLVN